MTNKTQLDSLRKQLSATNSYLNIGKWEDITETLKGNDEVIADAYRRLNIAIPQYQSVMHQIEGIIPIDATIRGFIDSEDSTSNPFGLTTDEVIECAYRPDVKRLLDSDVDWRRFSPKWKKLPKLLSKVATVDLSRTKNPWPIVMVEGGKFYSDINIYRCIALYWQRIPLFRLCWHLIRNKMGANDAKLIVLYDEANRRIKESEDFRNRISAFLSHDAADKNKTSSDENITNGNKPHNAAESDTVNANTPDIDPVEEAAIIKKRLLNMLFPFKRNADVDEFCFKLALKVRNRDLYQLIRQHTELYNADRGVKRGFYEMIVELGLYSKSYSNFCKRTM